MSDLSGKHGLIVGVANKRSISWAIAQAAAAAGARLALTYPSERLEENVRELAATLDNPLVLPCDVADDQQIAALGRDPRSRVRRARLSRPRCGVRAGRRLKNPFAETSREGFRDRARRQRLFADRADARRDAADGEARRRQHADAHVSRQRARVHELQRDGRREGGARVVGALPRGRSRPEEHPRQRGVGRCDQDAGGRRHLRGSRASCRRTARSRRCAAAWRRRGRRCRGVPARPRRPRRSPAKC